MRSTLGVPVVAIGGITAANAHALIDAGATALAVIADVFAHDDPADDHARGSRDCALASPPNRARGSASR